MKMAKYSCNECNYIFEEDKEGLFRDLTKDWKCKCGASKSKFHEINEKKEVNKEDPYEIVIKKLEEMEEGVPRRDWREFED